MPHYYKPHPDGTCHLVKSVPMVSDPTRFREPNLGDARRMGLLGSTTTVTACWDKKGLEHYKEKQHGEAGVRRALAAVENNEPVYDGNGGICEGLLRDVRESGRAHAEAAADLGTRVHKALEQGDIDELYDSRQYPFETELHGRVLTLYRRGVNWMRENTTADLKAEWSIWHPMGYAMTLDWLGRIGEQPWIIDYKTRGTKGGKAAKYDPDGLQLAAACLAVKHWTGLDCKAGNLIISTSEDVVVFSDWTDDLYRMTDAWRHLHYTWCLLNKYVPVIEFEEQEQEAA